MTLLQAIQRKLPKHKYAINVILLGDSSECAWSNLGFWHSENSYAQACQNLASHLAESLNLNSNDHVLDLGVGYGASLILWQDQYNIKNIHAVELQKHCVDIIKNKKINHLSVFQESYLNLKNIPFTYKFDVILCIDSAYHHNLNSFLASVTSVLNSKGRIGFHTLMLSERWKSLNSFQKQKYTWLLKAADVQIKNLNSKLELEKQLNEFKFENVHIEDLSKEVLFGFSNYVEQHLQCDKKDLDYLKIQMTAKLCKKLFNDGLIQYVQVIAHHQQ
jgi:cyclopropane fatty-acyl-phospholipid synthase-like methyltransferase